MEEIHSMDSCALYTYGVEFRRMCFYGSSVDILSFCIKMKL